MYSGIGSESCLGSKLLIMTKPLLAILLLLPLFVSAGNSKLTSPRLISAFFGLDNALPFRANIICLGASGADGMPVILSKTIPSDSLRKEQFQVITALGEVRTPKCVTLRPASDPGENRTVLLIGEFGDSPNNPPVSVRIVEDLLSDTSPPVNFKGAEVKVTPLGDGPSLVFAESLPESEWHRKGNGTLCPKDSLRQVIRVTWSGGVRLPNGDEPGDTERSLYTIIIDRGDGSRDEINPFAIAELGDSDNNHFLCLSSSDPAMSVTFPAGNFVDPNQDLNPETSIMLEHRP